MNRSFEVEIRRSVGESLPREEGCEDAKNLCAYNQTRGYVLGAEVACGDFSLVSLAERMPRLTPKSGAGLWMVPFRGIPTEDVRVPLDLIYLDPNHQVIEAVELFPTYRVSPSSPVAASVLALPTQSIFSSHTQPGDQILFGVAEEIEQEQARFISAHATAHAARTASIVSDTSVLAREEEIPQARPEEATAKAEAKKEISKPKNWLQRWLSPDPPEPRKAPRETLPGLAVYFWTGGTPKPHAILNISSTGMYVLTEERWYPGTLVQMTLKKTAPGKTIPECSISLLARANRWGNDGVGLSFVVRDPRNSRGGDDAQANSVSREELDQFLARIGWGNS
ncbi:MAG: hypothetical protein ABSF70_02090 [Terracidiphilus sp.]